MSKSSPIQSKVKIEIRILFSKPIGEEDSSGGSSGVKCKPIIVSKLPPRNRMIGTVNSIIARALRLGIGIKSALCWLNTPAKPKGQLTAIIGNAIGTTWPILTP